MDNDVSAVAQPAATANAGGEGEQLLQLFGAEKAADDRVSLPGEFSCKKTIEDRAKLIKERREQEQQRLLNELKMSEEKAEKIRRFKESERERKAREIRERDQTRRDHVTERRKQLEQQEMEKKREILAKFAKENVAGTNFSDGGSGHDEFSSDTATSSPKFVPRKQTKTHSYAFGSSTPRGLTFLDQLKSKQRAEGGGHVTASGNRLSSALATHLLGDGVSSGRSTPIANSMTTSVYVPTHVSSAHARVRVQPLSKDENSRTSEKNQSATVQKLRGKAQNDMMTKSLILPKSTTIEKAYSASKPSRPSAQIRQARKKSGATKAEKPQPVVQNLIPDSELVENLSSIGEAKNDDLPKPELSKTNLKEKEPLSPIVDNENLDNLSTIVEVGSIIAENSFENDENLEKFDEIFDKSNQILENSAQIFEKSTQKIDNLSEKVGKIETENGEIVMEEEGGGVSQADSTTPNSDSSQQNGGPASSAASANQKTLPKVLTEEEAKAALAERRRLAREQIEREKELERRREEEQRMADEEEFRRQEEEELRLIREARQAEEERLKMALEEQRLKKEEEEKRLQEEKQRLLEQEIKNKEINEKIDKEREEKLRQEEIDRLERKKKLDAIRQRTRLVNAESVPSNLADQSASTAPSANSHVTMGSSGSGPELTTLSSSGSDKNLSKASIDGESRDSTKESRDSTPILSTRDSVGNILSRVRSKMSNGGNGSSQNSTDFTHLTNLSIDQSAPSVATVAPPMISTDSEIVTDNGHVTTVTSHVTTVPGHMTTAPNLHNLSTSTMSYFSQNSRKIEIGDHENVENGNFPHFQQNNQTQSLSLPSFISQNNLINNKNLINSNDNFDNSTTNFMDLNANNAENQRNQGFSTMEIQNLNTKANSAIHQNEYYEMNGEDLINENANLHNGGEQNLVLDHKKPDFMNF